MVGEKLRVPSHLKNRRTVLVERFPCLRSSASARPILAIFGGVILISLSFARKPWTIDVPNAGAWKVYQYVAVYVWIGVLIDLVLTMLTEHWWTRPFARSRYGAACISRRTRETTSVVTREGRKKVRFDSEPEAGLAKRIKVRVLSWLAIEDLL